MVNRQIQLSTPARELCTELDGKSCAIGIKDSGLAARISVNNACVTLSGDVPDDADVILTGSLVTLPGLLFDGEQLIRDGAVDLIGDMEAAAKFQKLFRYGKPDIEEKLSEVIGDAAAHSLGEFARGVVDWSRQARGTLAQNIGEYLKEESRAVPNRYEVERFRAAVNSLRDDVARFEARLQRVDHGAD